MRRRADVSTKQQWARVDAVRPQATTSDIRHHAFRRAFVATAPVACALLVCVGMKTSCAIAFALLMVVVPAIASAQTVNPTAAAREATSQWYGWQTLATDGAAVALTLAGSALYADQTVSAASFFTAGATYVLGGPIVHVAHEQPWRAAASLGLRAGLPFALGAAGMGMEDCRRGGDFCGLGGFVVGFGAGMLAAVAIDAGLLAHESVPLDERHEAASSFSLRVAPTVSPDGKHAGMTMSGAF